MPTYSFTCRVCHRQRDVIYAMSGRQPLPSCCGQEMRRLYHAPAIVRGLVTETHFNRSLGEVVTSSADFRSKLDRKSDEMSARTGVEQRLVPVSPADVEPPGAREQLRQRQIEREGRPAKQVFA